MEGQKAILSLGGGLAPFSVLGEPISGDAITTQPLNGAARIQHKGMGKFSIEVL